MAKKNKQRRVEEIMQELRDLFPDSTQRMLHELRLLEDMKDETLGHLIGASRVSIGKWRIRGIAPNEEHKAKIADLHAKMMFLRDRGIMYRDFKYSKTIDQMCEEAKNRPVKSVAA